MIVYFMGYLKSFRSPENCKNLRYNLHQYMSYIMKKLRPQSLIYAILLLVVCFVTPFRGKAVLHQIDCIQKILLNQSFLIYTEMETLYPKYSCIKNIPNYSLFIKTNYIQKIPMNRLFLKQTETFYPKYNYIQKIPLNHLFFT